MNFFSIRTLTLLTVVFMLFGCAARQPFKPIPNFTLTPFNSNEYVSSIDNFLIIFDASSSMDDRYAGNKKFDMATQIVTRLNQSLPELGQNGALRSFGNSWVYGMEKYSQKAFAEKFKEISTPGGTSPMHAALTASGQEELKGISGKTAVLIISDGQKEVSLESPKTLKAAQILKDQVGEGLCYYPIFVGDNAQGLVLMEDISRIGKCGFVSNADNLLTDAGMSQFVKDVFLTKKPVPQTPAVVTPEPVVLKGVNAQGVWVVGEAFFDFDKSVLKPEAFDYLNQVVEELKTYPQIKVNIQGHTDSIGTKIYNDALSIRRAQAVKIYLTTRGISGDRLTLEGFGFSKPVATNKTNKGRALNRRVEIHPVK